MRNLHAYKNVMFLFIEVLLLLYFGIISIYLFFKSLPKSYEPVVYPVA